MNWRQVLSWTEHPMPSIDSYIQQAQEGDSFSKLVVEVAKEAHNKYPSAEVDVDAIASTLKTYFTEFLRDNSENTAAIMSYYIVEGIAVFVTDMIITLGDLFINE